MCSRAWLNLGFVLISSFLKHMSDIDAFVDKWCYGEALCSVRGRELTFSLALAKEIA